MVIMNNEQRADLSKKVLQVIQSLQSTSNSWVDFACIGAPLIASGVQYKQYGFLKLRHFLNEFQDILELKDEYPAKGKPPVCYVRPRLSDNNSTPESIISSSSIDKCEKIPSKSSWLFKWASIPSVKIEQLSKLALEEKWYYGDEETQTQEQKDLPILRNYLAYTFKRLCFEKKILIKTDLERDEEYAAFNTGLVDKKYENIYALFKQNTRYRTPYWYLLDFVVAGEDTGKTLNKLFNPLPKRANYFEGKIQNMLFDTSTGELYCDYDHIITERTSRFPTEFLEENCSLDFLCIDGISIKDAGFKSLSKEEKKSYYESLGKKIENNQKILNRLKNRIDDAVKLAKKKVEWNYKTAIPMYFPKGNTGSLLLPLSLVDEEHVDLALVVERQPSGTYQGQTLLPLHLAYSNSRLITRPDSDWLKTDIINVTDLDDDDE